MKKTLYFLPLALAVSCGNPESASNESNEETTEKIEVSEPKIVGKEVTYEGDSIS